MELESSEKLAKGYDTIKDDFFHVFLTMTKKEYKELLKSDYWKGYSFSLIKERNFTCQDCGRQFINQRNKLQVHHLRYREAKPWSYNPNELVVLCEDCHKKRHGISDDNVDFIKRFQLRDFFRFILPSPQTIKSTISKSAIVIFLGFLLLLFIPTILKDDLNSQQQTIQDTVVVEKKVIHKKKSRKQKNNKKTEEIIINTEITEEKTYGNPTKSEDSCVTTPQKDVADKNVISDGVSAKTMFEIMEHDDAVKRAKKAGVSTEGTTQEILERLSAKP